jgi:hypothetical protein
VEFYNLMADCCLLADKADDDFYRAEAGVEAAMGLVLGGKPIVGYSVKSGAKVQVLRDFDLTLDDSDVGTLQMPIGAPTPDSAREASEKEMKRLNDKVTPTMLEPGETVIVPHWEVTRIWNFAMKSHSRLEIFEYGQYVYGETIGWDIGEGFLKGKCGSLVPMLYITCPQVGFLNTRDKGSFPCDHCGKVESNLQRCARCKNRNTAVVTARKVHGRHTKANALLSTRGDDATAINDNCFLEYRSSYEMAAAAFVQRKVLL